MKKRDLYHGIIIALIIAVACALNTTYQTNKLITQIQAENSENVINLSEVTGTVTTPDGIYLYTNDGNNYYLKH